MSLRKFGRYYWLDMRIHGRRIRRSLKTDEHALAIERAREIQDELPQAADKISKKLESPLQKIFHDLILPAFSTGLRRTIGQIRKATGIDFHFHLLRHFFTTALLEKGVDFVTIGSLLGHSKITTSLIYSHTDRERKKRALELLEG
jgi:integrase